MPDGRVLRGWSTETDYSTDHCLGAACYNPQLNVFDPKKYDAGENPWTVWRDKAMIDFMKDWRIYEAVHAEIP